MQTTNIDHPYLIFELANSHGGDSKKIYELIQEFGKIKYPEKGIKFQIFHPDKISLPDFPWHNVYQELFFEKSKWESLIKNAAIHGDVWIDIFDVYSVEILEENISLIHGIKLQASVLENNEVLSALESLDLSSKQLIINVSGYEINHIHDFLNTFRNISSNIIIQTGFQAYPTLVKDTGLQKIPVLRAAFPHFKHGMADHADGRSDFAQLNPIYAVAMGCSHIEKHFCLSRSEAKYDGYSALEPSEMIALCKRLHEFSESKQGLFISQAENNYLISSIQTPVTKFQIEANSRIDPEHLIYRRTVQKGLSWSKINELQKQGFRLSRKMEELKTVTENYFTKAKVGVVVACRMKSTRLPKKAILPIAGIASVERCLEQCLAMKNVEKVILATSNLSEDSILTNYLANQRACIWTGDPEDVIKRYIGACDEHNIDVIIRVTADCPVISHEIAEYLLEQHFKSGADYTAATDCAVGTACEIIEVSALKQILNTLGAAKHSEYMTWYFQNNKEHFRINIADLPEEFRRNYRLTLDHAEDLELFEIIYQELGKERQPLSIKEIFNFLDSNPEISKINQHITLKYRTDKELIETLDRETKFPPKSDSDFNEKNKQT